ncbi:hypothetical protein Y1Q_0018904 [Alligator mississippiensis]|uniref:Uncharacterized protein n=1 Tax=Alligator mississippiensis TaxID=8496 RepID=A0A151M357_ALLMI|nr:hypothetical protein Y1Q_0018904 [Alligator mississippiensis]
MEVQTSTLTYLTGLRTDPERVQSPVEYCSCIQFPVMADAIMPLHHPSRNQEVTYEVCGWCCALLLVFHCCICTRKCQLCAT